MTSLTRNLLFFCAIAAALLSGAGCDTASPQQVEPAAAPPASSAEGGTVELSGPAPPPPLTPPPGNLTSTSDILTTGSVAITVADPVAAAEKSVSATVDAGGRIHSRSERSGSSGPQTVELVLRIPSDRINAVLTDIDQMGVVQSETVTYDDITSEGAGLDARCTALQTSVTRLLELMAKATNTSDLLAAESSLTQRQAELDSLRAQQVNLDDQIRYATITVTLSPQSEQPGSGFVDALRQGWRAVSRSAVGLAHVIGFLLPWVPLAVAVTLAVRWARGLVRRRAEPDRLRER